MLRAELKKCLSFRVLWILLFCLLCINGYSQITNAYNRYYTPSEYNALYEQLDGMSLQEANAFVSAKIEAASPDSDALSGIFGEHSNQCREYDSSFYLGRYRHFFLSEHSKNAIRLYSPCWNHTGFGYLSWRRGFAVQSLDGFLGGAVAILLRLPYFFTGSGTRHFAAALCDAQRKTSTDEL